MQISQVVHFLTILEMVDHQDVRLATLVELLDQVASNEAGTAGDDDHALNTFGWKR
jgi:hypothetical protein